MLKNENNFEIIGQRTENSDVMHRREKMLKLRMSRSKNREMLRAEC